MARTGPARRSDDGAESSGADPVRKNLWRAAKLLAVALVVNYLVLPQLAGARRAWELVTEVQPLLLAAGLALQVGAYLAHAQLTRAVLPEEHRPSLLGMARIEVASRAVSHVVPGGTAAGTALGFRLLQRRGVPGSDAGFAMGTQGIGAAVVLNVLLWCALVVSIPLRGVNPLYGTAAAIGAVAIGGFAALVLLLLRAEQGSRRVARKVIGRIPLVDPERVEEVVARIAERVRDLSGDRRLMARAVGWAALHWISDGASLYMFLLAFGVAPGLDGFVIAFGIANVLAAIPITPRGLGVVEATLITLLVGFGIPRGEAILGVISYRLVAFWLPIPVGAAAYVSIRVGSTDEGRREGDAPEPSAAATDEVSEAEAGPSRREVERDRGSGVPPRRRDIALEAVEEVAGEAESVREWADRTGLAPPARTTAERGRRRQG
jgi:uncharacterized protein (TIRG00374 family)